MKIALIGIKGLPSKGGAERVVEAIVQRLSSQHTLTVNCSRHHSAFRACVPGVSLVSIRTRHRFLLRRIVWPPFRTPIVFYC